MKPTLSYHFVSADEGTGIGLTIVLMLMIFATFNDIVHLASRLT